MRLLGLDFGSKNIGLAICDEQARVATPLKVLRRQGTDADIAEIKRIFEEAGVGALVLGLPLTLSGEEGAGARRVRRFGALLIERLGCVVHYIDERFSSAQAERVLLEADVSRAKRKLSLDHLAATLILQSFIDRRAWEAAS